MRLQSLERRFEKRILHPPGLAYFVKLKTLEGCYMSNIVKVCKIHGNLKLNEIYISNNLKSCKKCVLINSRKRQSKNKELIKIYLKQYKKLHPEKFKERQKKYQEKNRDLITQKMIIRNINISLDKYQSMFNEQDNKCYICRKEETKINFQSKRVARLSLDHCHKTNNPRRLLCHNCNIMIGASKESIEILQEAINYLKEFNYDRPRE